MSAFHWPWPVLGIAPTDDRKTIREAYARLLKALDPDAATEAFMELRDARDAALSGQFLHPPRAEGEEEDDFGLGTPLPEGTATPETPPPADHPPEPEERPVFTVAYSDDDDRRFQRVVDLLLGEAPLTAADNDEINRHLDTLFADDRMADLGHYARIETWLAQLLAERFPRGAAFFPRIAEHFEWGTRAHELGIHPAIPWLFNSHEGHSLVSELETPGHAYHREWIELARGKPKGPLWTRAIDKPRMANLIGTIRRDYPWLEQEHWQPELVERWEKKVAKNSRGSSDYWIWIVVAALFFVLLPRMIHGGATPDDAAATPAMSYGNVEGADQAIDAVLRRNFPEAVAEGIGMIAIRQNNEKLYSNLEAYWTMHHATPDKFERAVRDEVARSHLLLIGDREHAIQMEEVRHRQYVLAQLGSEGQYPLCARFLRDPRGFIDDPTNDEYMPGNYRDHMLRTVYDEANNAAPVQVGEAPAPSDALLSRIGGKSGVRPQILRVAVTRNIESDANLCLAMKALYGAASDLPKRDAEQLIPALLRWRP